MNHCFMLLHRIVQAQITVHQKLSYPLRSYHLELVYDLQLSRGQQVTQQSHFTWHRQESMVQHILLDTYHNQTVHH